MIGAKIISLLAAAVLAGGGHSAAARVPPPVPPPTLPLEGKVVGIDPGHNGGNFSDPSLIDKPVWNGREEEACDTTGTETDGGYTEARFNFDVATYLRRDLPNPALDTRVDERVARRVHAADGDRERGASVVVVAAPADGARLHARHFHHLSHGEASLCSPIPYPTDDKPFFARLMGCHECHFQGKASLS